MTDALADRVNRYVLDGGDADLRRLLRFSEVLAAESRAALTRVGVGSGWSAIDCGCGPAGGLTVLAGLVGPSGRVVGVDFADATVTRAREVMAELEIDNVDLIRGDVTDMDVGTAGGPFDVAYTRCFLMHQPDPVQVLTQISGLLRPGGWVIAQEPLRTPPPQSYPPCAELRSYWEVLQEVIERAGVPRDTVARLPSAAKQAGLEVVHSNGFVKMVEPRLGFELHAATLAAAKDRASAFGIATEQEIDNLVASLREAADGSYEWVGSPTYFDLALRKP